MIGNVNSGMFTKDQAAKSFSGQVARLMPAGDAPLFGLTSMLKTETALQFNHGYFSKTMVFPAVTTSTSQLISDTLLNVISTANIIPGMVLRVDGTGENVYVTGIVGNFQIQVQRGFGQIAAQAIGSSVLMIQVGNANEESSTSPLAFTIQMAFDTNFTQIFRNTWAVSGTAAATQMIAGEGNVGESKMDCAAMHAADIEKALFFGQKYIGSRNGQLFHTMDGILSLITQKVPANIVTLGATTNFTQLETAIDPLFNIRSDQMSGTERIMFVGGTARRVLNKIAQLNGTYFIQDGQTSFGLQFSTFKLTRGTFRIIEHPLFNAFGASSSYAKMAVIVDMPAFNLAYLGNRKTKATDMVGDDGTDAVSGTLLTELTMLIKNPQAFGILFNFTAGAAG
jgi:hypothetical protein